MPVELTGARPNRPMKGRRVEGSRGFLAASLPIFMAALVFTGGCRHEDLHSEEGYAHVETGRVVERTRIEPEIQVAPTSLEEVGGQRTYWGMTPRNTQCLAAEKSGTAAMMEAEYQALA